MDDLATVRAQIKSWERSFKEQHGCPPTVNDIKENNHIAEKYKQYKKLSKAAAQPQKLTTKVITNSAPITPPRKTRPTEPPSLILSKSRPIQPSAPLTAFNPFSPEKKQKGKERERINTSRIKESRSNPFSKSPSRIERQILSPDPFPPIHDLQPSSSASTPPFALHLPPVPTSAVSRARKRLRGEPVSPSPIKDKKRRITSQTTIHFPRLTLDAANSDDGEDAPAEADSSFVDNSPVKPSTNKNFPRLFQEELEKDVEVFGDAYLEDRNKPLIKRIHDVGKSKAIEQGNISRPASRGLVTTKLDSKIQQKVETLLNVNAGAALSRTPSSRSSTKRPFSDDEEVDEFDQPPPPRAKSPLIPPSPPPSNSNSTSNRPGKHKPTLKGRTAKGNASQKKLKLNGEHAEDDSDELQSKGKLRIVGRNGTRLGHAGKGPEEDYVSFETDPILGYARFSGPHASSPNDAQQEDGNVEIDLPEQLRRVLALQSAGSKLQLSEEDRLLKGLLYGRRTSYYDPMKGGEIWDVGEDHQVMSEGGSHKYTEDEEDWEGEPVPWEMGEL